MSLKVTPTRCHALVCWVAIAPSPLRPQGGTSYSQRAGRGSVLGFGGVLEIFGLLGSIGSSSSSRAYSKILSARITGTRIVLVIPFRH